MAEDKTSILVYADWIKKFEALSDEEAGRLIKHFFRYVNDMNPVAPDRITELSFIDIEQSLKRDLKRWENKKSALSDSGSMGNLKRWHNDLYLKVVKKEISLEEAVSIASDRKQSPPDEFVSPPDKKIAVSVSDIVKKDNTNTIIGDSSAKNSPKQSLEERKALFKKTIIPFVKTDKNPLGKFDAEMAKEFFEHWTEPNKSGTKMLFELKPTWSIELRLNKWKRNGFSQKKEGFSKDRTTTDSSLSVIN